MLVQDVPDHVQAVLIKLEGVRRTQDGWDALCPCLSHNAASGQPGDHHPSLRIAIGDGGRLLIKCRVGCRTEEVLDAVGLTWSNVFIMDGNVGSTMLMPMEPTTVAPADLVRTAYGFLLRELQLEPDHRQQLRQRGLSDEAIDRNEYRTLRNVDRGRAAKAVHHQLGDGVLNVPGFNKSMFGITLMGTATGLLIPMRDVKGQIQALKIRRSTDPKYVYLSGSETGASSGSPAHVPIGMSSPASTVRVTEGELKADVCTLLDTTPTIGVPGVAQWRTAIAVLKELAAKTVIISFDAPDLHEKLPVFEQAEAFWRTLKDEGFKVDVEDWQWHS
jgi:hypothetical protein